MSSYVSVLPNCPDFSSPDCLERVCQLQSIALTNWSSTCCTFAMAWTRALLTALLTSGVACWESHKWIWFI